MLGEQFPLLAGQQAFERRPAERDVADLGVVDLRLQRARADERARYRVDLDDERRRLAQALRHLVRHDRPKLHDGVAALALHAPAANDDSGPVEVERGRVEEVHLPDLRVERVDAERSRGRVLVGLRHRQLQLHAVGAGRQLQQLFQLLIIERRSDGTRRRHAPSLIAAVSGCKGVRIRRAVVRACCRRMRGYA